MKKTYIAPESRLFSINLRENIAASDVVTNGTDVIDASIKILFTVDVDPCRKYYTGSDDSPNPRPVNPSNSAFMDYYNELRGYNDYQVYFECLHAVSNT